MPLFNDSTNLIYPGHPGFVSGKYYASTSYASTATTGSNVGFFYYTYFFIPFLQNFNKIAFWTTTTPSGTQQARFAIYQVESGLPSKLIADLGNISFTSSGAKEISCSVSLSPGWYAIATMFNPYTITLYCPAFVLSNLLGLASISQVNFTGFRAILPFGNFPNNASVSSLTEITAPLIWLKTT